MSLVPTAVAGGDPRDGLRYVRRMLDLYPEDPADEPLGRKLDRVLERTPGASLDEVRAQFTEWEIARIDSVIHGTGFLIDGRRVAPDRVTLLPWRGP